MIYPCMMKRKSWHFTGLILVSTGFTLFFSGVDDRTFHYFCVILFQVGWSIVQISHLSLLNCIAETDKGRNVLNSSRYIFTVLANLAVYLVMFFLLQNLDGNDMHKC